LSDAEAVAGVAPPQGSVKWYDDFLKILESRNVAKVDKTFLQNQSMASGNESKMISGLKFLGLIDKEGNATETMNSLSVKGEKRKENLEKVVRTAYSLLFDVVKIKLEEADSDTLVNCFKTDYKMGSLTTAEQGARIFVFLTQQAGIPLSQSIVEKLAVSLERAKALSQTARKPRAQKPIPEPQAGQIIRKLPEEVLARFELKDTGYVDIKSKDDFEIAKAYWKALAKKLGITEEIES